MSNSCSSTADSSGSDGYKGSETQTKKEQEERNITVGLDISGSPSWIDTLSRTKREEEDMKEFDYDLMTKEADLLLVNNKVPTMSGAIRSVGRQLVLTRSPSRACSRCSALPRWRMRSSWRVHSFTGSTP